MKSYEERREERRQYENDVFYEVWRSGGNPDGIDYDRVRDHYYDGYSSEESAGYELRSQRNRHSEEDEEQQDEEQP